MKQDMFLIFASHCSLFMSCKYFIALSTKIIYFIFGSIVQHCFSSKIETDLPFYFYRNVHQLSFIYKDEARKNIKIPYHKAAPPKYSPAIYFFMLCRRLTVISPSVTMVGSSYAITISFQLSYCVTVYLPYK